MNTKTDLWIISNSLFLSWENLKTLMDFRLSALLGRNISTVPFQDGDYWDAKTGAISSAEMKRLFEIAGADEEDKRNHSGENLSMNSVTDAFALKLLAAELPFPAKKAVPTEDGVYFIGQDAPYTKVYQFREENDHESR